MLKVLHVVSYFPPDRLGGVGEVVAHVHRALKAAGHASTVLTTGTSADGPDVRRAAATPGAFGLVAARHTFLAEQADIVHIHHGEGVGLLVAMRALGIRTPVLLTLHVSVESMRRSLGPYHVAGRAFCPDTPSNWAYRNVTMRVRSAMDRLAIVLADRLSFISRSAATDVLGTKKGTSATVIYNGVPPASPGGQPVPPLAELLFVGANTERKRVELLPLILAHVRRRLPDARLRVVGMQRHDNPGLLALARELSVLDGFEFVGQIRSGDLGRYYRSAGALLVPSAYEGLPMVILEAMGHGLPVVATRVSGHPEVIEDGVNGLLVPLDDPAAMADAALRILEDASLGARFSNAGRVVALDRFSVERQVEGYLAEYEQLRRRRSVQ